MLVVISYRSYPIFSISQYIPINSFCSRDSTSSYIGSLLQSVTTLTSRPLPVHTMPGRGLIQSLPPLLVSLPSIAAIHSFDDITRVGKKINITRFSQILQTNRRCYYFRLLIRRLPNVFAKSAPDSFVT